MFVMFAVIRVGGKQYLVEKGSVIEVEKLEATENQEVEFDQVVCFSESGLSYSPGPTVRAEVLEQRRAKKILIFKKKRRKNYRRKAGHRQYMTLLRINEIILRN